MIEIELDGKKVDIVEGSMIMHAADKAGTYIPHFCYHKKLRPTAACVWWTWKRCLSPCLLAPPR
jgi:NADH-quinone oxidoreductase subunit G